MLLALAIFGALLSLTSLGWAIYMIVSDDLSAPTWPLMLWIPGIIISLACFAISLNQIAERTQQEYEQTCVEQGGVVTHDDEGTGLCVTPDGRIVPLEEVK